MKSRLIGRGICRDGYCWKCGYWVYCCGDDVGQATVSNMDTILNLPTRMQMGRSERSHFTLEFSNELTLLASRLLPSKLTNRRPFSASFHCTQSSIDARYSIINHHESCSIICQQSMDKFSASSPTNPHICSPCSSALFPLEFTPCTLLNHRLLSS